MFQACPTRKGPQGKTQDTLERLCLYIWPGNDPVSGGGGRGEIDLQTDPNGWMDYS